MCCEAEWKREVVEDYKWEYVDVREFHNTSFTTRFRYCFVYLFLLKNLAIYGLDIFTATTMLITDNWTNALYTKCSKSGTGKCDVDVKFGIAKWVFVGCIIFSFLLLAYEIWRARQVILSRDIAYAFTNVMANDYFSIKNYDNFCLFCKISTQKKKKDKLAFFVFFTFKDWKRVIVCDGPRQSINAIILWTILKAYNFETQDIKQYWDGNPWTLMLLLSMITTVLIFLVSFGLMIVAAVFYVPLLCYIQGNLKEYVCHKVDKRIGDIIRKYQKRRIRRNAELEQKLAQGGMQIKNSKGEYIDASLLQPTLPNIANIDLATDTKTAYSRPSSPAYGRSVSPAYGRSASPAPGYTRTASPAFNRAPAGAPAGRHSPDYNRAEKQTYPDYADYPDYPDTYREDIFESYSFDDHSDASHTQGYMAYSSSSVNLLSAAAPPGRALVGGGVGGGPGGAAPTYPPRAAGPPSYRSRPDAGQQQQQQQHWPQDASRVYPGDRGGYGQQQHSQGWR